MDEGFDTYVVMGEGFSSEVEEIIMHFIVTSDDEASVAVDMFVAYREGLSTAVNFLLKVRGGNIIMCAQKITKLYSR